MATIVTLKKGEGRSFKAGGAWIFDNEIESVMGHYQNGDVAVLKDFDGYPLGLGMLNARSKIRMRMLCRDVEAVIDEAFWEKKLRRAWEYRKKCVDTSCCRVVFGEADGIPGFIMDKYSDVLVIQSLSLGIDRYKALLVDLAKRILAQDGIEIRGVYERSDAKEREKEGMEKRKGFLGDAFDTNVPITENGVKYLVDVKDGQKTGFFLDQKYNRLAIQRFCMDAEVLDCFTHTGSFGLNAAIAGAKSVLSVDASETALAQAGENAALNGVSDIVRYQCADVFELLPQLEEEGRSYDVVILDPPAFTKAKGSVKNAAKGYREINLRGMRLVKDGGYLASCSCSHFMEEELFCKVLREAAVSAHVRLRQVEARQQAPDHPVLWAAESSYYLKFYIFQVLKEL